MKMKRKKEGMTRTGRTLETAHESMLLHMIEATTQIELIDARHLNDCCYSSHGKLLFMSLLLPALS